MPTRETEELQDLVEMSKLIAVKNEKAEMEELVASLKETVQKVKTVSVNGFNPQILNILSPLDTRTGQS